MLYDCCYLCRLTSPFYGFPRCRPLPTPTSANWTSASKMTCSPKIYWTLLILFLASYGVLASSVNRTIDDVKGDNFSGLLPSYSPSPDINWNVGPQCSDCHIQLNASQTFDGTWHDATSGRDSRSVTLFFTGTAIYVYGVIANTVTIPGQVTSTTTNLTFRLDGEFVGSFIHQPTASMDFEYNVLFYTNDSIPNGQHVLVFESTSLEQEHFLILFDYAIYTYVDDTDILPPSCTASSANVTSTPSTNATTATTLAFGASISSPPSSTTSSQDPSLTASADSSHDSDYMSMSESSRHHRIIIGALIGGIIGGLILLAILLLLLRRRFRRRQAARQVRPAPIAAIYEFMSLTLLTLSTRYSYLPTHQDLRSAATQNRIQ